MVTKDRIEHLTKKYAYLFEANQNPTKHFKASIKRFKRQSLGRAQETTGETSYLSSQTQ